MQVTRRVMGSLGVNTYIANTQENHCFLVDVGEHPKNLIDWLQEKNLTPVAILLTHGHFDHVAGVEAVRQAFHCPVYIHPADQDMLIDSDANLGKWLSDEAFQPITEWELVEDGQVLDIDGKAITVMQTPGHTKGSVCYFCEDVLFSGDTLFRLSRGRTDFPGGSDAEMLASLRKLASIQEEYRVFPGHNETSTLSYEKIHNPNLQV